MTEELELLARLRVAVATGYLPPDVGVWAVETAREQISTHTREAARVRLLREAGRLTGLPRKAAARELRRLILEQRAAAWYYSRKIPERGTVAGLVHAALLVDPAAGASVRQLWRILEL